MYVMYMVLARIHKFLFHTKEFHMNFGGLQFLQKK